MTSLLNPQTPTPDPRPWLDTAIDERQRRMVRIGDHWLADFASCSYLGLDLDPSVVDAAPGAPVRCEEIEAKLTTLLGSEDTLVMPTRADIHRSAIPLLAGTGTIFIAARAHPSLHDGCELARSRGAAVKRFRPEEPDHLAQLLDETPGGGAKLVCLDGIDPMTGNVADLRALAAVARHHNALLYVDDAAGFGVLGERQPHETCAYGHRGNGLVKHANETYDSIVLVGDCAKAYASPLAFIACPTELKNALKLGASSPTSATVLEGLRVNEDRGDALRARLCALTLRVLETVDRVGAHTSNRSGFPIIELAVRDHTRIDAVGQFLFARGIRVAAAEAGFRVHVTAANTDDEIFMLCETIEELTERGELKCESSRECPHGLS